MSIRNYRDLKVWQRSIDLVLQRYGVTRSFPSSERYDLVRQIRRSAVSIPSNIAEGHGRDHLGDYLRHLSIANGSLMELETQLWISNRLAFVDDETLEHIRNQTQQLGRMLAGLTRKLKIRRERSPTPDTRHLTPGT